MATSANGDTFTLPQYGGMVVQGVPNVTPALSLISRVSGGLNILSPGQGGITTTDGLKISWENAPQRGVTNQDGVVEGGTPTSRNNIYTQEYNVLQIFQEGFELTYSRNSGRGTLMSGATATLVNGTTVGTGMTQKDKQTVDAILSIQRALNYQIHHGTRTMPANNSSARIMGGFRTLAGWTKTGEGEALTKTLLNAFLKDGFQTYGALRGVGPYVLFCDANTKEKISDLYSASRVLPSSKVADVTVNYIDTDYGMVLVVLDPACYTYSMTCVDLSELSIYGLNSIDPDTNASKGTFFLEAMARTAAKQQWQIYGEVTLGFGHANHIGYYNGIGGVSAAPSSY